MLKYLFRAFFTDDSVIAQTQDDVSVIDEKRSQFYDVLQSDKQLKKFSIEGDGNIFSVNLLTGRFTINGVEMIVEGDKAVPKSYPDYRLIFYRQHQHDFNPESQEETAHRVTYFIGWQTLIEGRNYQSVIGIT